MSLFRLNPNATRECPCWCHRGCSLAASFDCKPCSGTGRVPAEPDVEVLLDDGSGEWWWRKLELEPDGRLIHGGQYPTEAAALKAAREESK